MPRHLYLGKQSKDYEKSDRYFQTDVLFSDIVNDIKEGKIKKPNYQGSLLDDKVEQMCKEYILNPLSLRFKSYITIGCLKDKWYLIDGQHRLEMAKNIYINHKIDDKLTFGWFICSNEQELRDMFISINHDSIKNQFYVNMRDFKQIIIDEFIGKLKKYNGQYFSKKQTNNGRKYTVEELTNLLNDISFFDNYDNSQDIYKSLIELNKEFYDINRYDVTFTNNSSSFYKDEGICIKDGIIFTLKRNNFIEWISDKNIKPYHKTYHRKSPISSYKRNIVWINEFGIKNSGICPISFCNNSLKKGVKNGFQCGHIISEYNGGETEPNNLRPICQGCNASMGYKNWEEWDKTSISES